MLLKEVCNLLATAWKVACTVESIEYAKLYYYRGCYSAFTNGRQVGKTLFHHANLYSRKLIFRGAWEIAV